MGPVARPFALAFPDRGDGHNVPLDDLASPGLFDSILTVFGGKAPYLLDTPNDALIVVIVANIWIGVPFFYLVIQSGLQTISPVLHEAALVDGCSWWKELTRITIPLLRETILTVLMLGIAGTMNVFALRLDPDDGRPRRRHDAPRPARLHSGLCRVQLRPGGRNHPRRGRNPLMHRRHVLACHPFEIRGSTAGQSRATAMPPREAYA